MDFPNYYNILQLDRTASEEQIWLSYHRLAYLEEQKKDADLRKLFWLNEAYTTLIHPEVKQLYDSALDRYRYKNMSYSFRRKAVIFLTGFFAAIVSVALMHVRFLPQKNVSPNNFLAHIQKI